MARKKTITEFLEQAKSIHGEKYDYSKVVYESTQKPIEIICKIHGSFFQRPLDHLHGQNCPHCSHRSFRYTTEEFIELARKIHGGKYDYSKVEYINNQTKVCIICPKHGEFYTYPMHHMRGVGCPDCQNSILEEKTARELEKHKLEYIWHCRKEDLSWLGKQSLDFYLPKYKIAIECQGIQHFEPVKFFGGEKSFKYRVKLDENKLKLCSDNAVKMFYINYNDNLENKIKELVEICSG